MNRICVIVEGQTEKNFVETLLVPYFQTKNLLIFTLLMRSLGRSFRYQNIQRNILTTLKQDSSLYCTMMADFYGMPGDWPGRREADTFNNYLKKAQYVEQSLHKDICSRLGNSFNAAHFIPYVQMHEFEALLFASPAILMKYSGGKKAEREILSICNQFSCPEEINDNYETCPSLRIVNVFPKYQKVLDGVKVCQKAGLDVIRSKCPHFDEWICKLEKIGE